ncbi:MAG: hypothetical protein V4555_17960 [Acidobacteriota bacterium]
MSEPAVPAAAESIAEVKSEAAAANPAHWHPATRLAFRFAFCYTLIYALGCGNATLWEAIPFHIGEKLEDWTSKPFFLAGQWLANHWFHLQGVGARLHDTGSGDTAINWIAVGIMLVLAIVVTAIWAVLDRKRTHYTRLFAWMRFILRLSLSWAMFNYGLAKVFPLQMHPPSLAVLNEPLGNSSPMTLLWTLIGLNPLYEMICGATEVAAGLLLLFRRTALLGSLFCAFVVSNVVLYNYFFDVPVRLYATHLLLLSVVLVAPDMHSLYNYFIRHRPSAPSADRYPFSRRLRITQLVCSLLVLLVVILSACTDLRKGYARQLANERHPSVFTGQWHIDSATLNGQPKPYTTGEGLPATDFFLDPSGAAMTRASDALWRGGYHADDKKHTLGIGSVGHGGVTYAVTQPDPNHVTLTPTGDDAKTEPTLQLTRVPLPSHYPLEDRGFHWINEWGLER